MSVRRDSRFKRWYWCVCLLGLATARADVGDNCALQKTGAAGRCKLLGDCDAALEGIRRQQFPQLCGFSGTVPIVCCELPPAPPPPPSSTAPPSPPPNRPARRPGDISRQKCQEYSQYNYELVRPPTLAGDSARVNVSVCAHKVVPLIIGGEPAKLREFPHQAALGYGDADSRTWQCGGTLISERFVLTAGHCLYAQELGEVRWVRLGDLDLRSSADGARPVDLEIQEALRHPDYKPPSNYNDIALLRLRTAAPLSKFVKPACLQVERDTHTQRVLASGWGRTAYGGDASDLLLKVVLDLFSHDQCNRTYRFDSNTRRLRLGILDETQMCAGGRDAERDTCQGDSGGPLQIFHPTVKCMYSVVGVTSFGKTCGVQNIPGVYTRVSYYVPWIESVVWPGE